MHIGSSSNLLVHNFDCFRVAENAKSPSLTVNNCKVIARLHLQVLGSPCKTAEAAGSSPVAPKS